MPALYPNYFFVGSLIAFLFCLYIGTFLFRIKDKSPATFQFGMTMLYMGLFNLSYVAAQGFYPLPTFVPRLLNIYTALGGALHGALFFRNFPTPLSAKATRWHGIIGYTIITAAAIYLGYAMYKAPVYFLFNSDFWDSYTLPLQKAFGLLILLTFLNFIITGIWRGFKEKGIERATVWLMTFAFVVVTVVPGILNILSRDNLIPRSAYQTTITTFNLIGFFFAIVLYLNVTRDRTSVHARIVSISLVTMLLIMQASSFYWLKDAEHNFDAVMYGRAREGYVLGRLPEGAKAVYMYNYGTQKLITPIPGEYFGNSEFAQQAQATELASELILLKEKGPELKQAAIKTVETAALYSPLQVAYLREYISGHEFSTGAQIAEGIFALRRQQLYQVAKLQQLTPSDLGKKLASQIKVIDGKFPGVERYVASLPTPISAEELRQLLIGGLTPWNRQGERLYRGNIFYEDHVPEHFIAYQFADTSQKRIIEVAFPYVLYRQTLAADSWPLVIIILAAFVLIVIGFALFFRGALMKPINALIDGLKQIDNDNFDARVKVRVEDEIGFMAKSFNKMARSIKAGRMRLQQYADQLEQKVKDRTHELQTTLQDVQKLKAQQDGDYFLTTLLLKPLGVNEVNSRFIGIESFVRQKKKFEFRHWSKDIGGDINISHVIELEGKRYIAFVNGDAMGKSIQGAGGALVLGSVFHTIIERTEATKIMQNLSPERWLKNAFIELHKVFESFDGSMLVSGFFGLLDEETGLMYHILAEHPRAVIYREGKASFLENDKMLRKLGTSGVDGTLQIATTQLAPGDVLIVGSDGRDDIILGFSDEGDRIINEDEFLFLRNVEETDGKIPELVDKLESLGEIMDDLSLMRIERYVEEHAAKNAFDYQGVLDGVKRDLKSGDSNRAISRIEAYLKQDAFYPEAVKNLSQIYYQIGNYEKAAQYAQDYLWLKPADADFVYFASLCYRRIRDFRRSIDLCERLRLREYPLPKNLALLTDLHIRTGNIKRAETILAELIELDSSFASIGILRKKLENAKAEHEVATPTQAT
jgi:HAMP domain-containing protein